MALGVDVDYAVELIAGAVNGADVLWETAAHKLRGSQLSAHGRSVYDVVFGPSGRILAAGSEHGTAPLCPGFSWRVSPDLKQQVRSRAWSGLSRNEWAQSAPLFGIETAARRDVEPKFSSMQGQQDVNRIASPDTSVGYLRAAVGG